jgi:Holliday junction resolvasome RuvABC endonuclease subunit
VRALGLYVRIADGRYRFGFSLVENATVIESTSIPAPAGEAEERQLHELFSRAIDIFREWKPTQAGLWTSEVQRHAAAARAHRAEGVVLAAASARSCPVALYSRQRLANHAPGSKSVASKVTTILCGRLSHPPEIEEARRAAAVALAVSLQGGS